MPMGVPQGRDGGGSPWGSHWVGMGGGVPMGVPQGRDGGTTGQGPPDPNSLLRQLRQRQFLHLQDPAQEQESPGEGEKP